MTCFRETKHRSLAAIAEVAAKSYLNVESERFLKALVSQHSKELIRTVMQSIINGRTMSEKSALVAETELFCSLVEQRQQE